MGSIRLVAWVGVSPRYSATWRLQILVIGVCGGTLLRCESGRGSETWSREPPVEASAPNTAPRAMFSVSSVATSAPVARHEPYMKGPFPNGVRVLAQWPQPATLFVPPKAAFVPKPKPNGDGCGSTKVIHTRGSLGEDPAQALVTVKAKQISLQLTNLKSSRRLTLEGQLDQSFCENSILTSAVLLRVGARRTGKDGILLGWSVAIGSERLHLDAKLDLDGESVDLDLWDITESDLDSYPRERDLLLRQAGIAIDVKQMIELPDETRVALGLSAGLPRDAFFAELSHAPPSVRRTSDSTLSCGEYACEAALAAFEVAPNVVVLLPRLSVHPWEGKCTNTNAEIWTHASASLGLGGRLAETEDCVGGMNYPSRSTSTSLYWVDTDGAPPLEILSAHTDEGTTDLEVFAYDREKASYQRTTEETPKATLQELLELVPNATSFGAY
jgi:hypothetical protein